ncbi:MAG: carbohydrate-binding protein [Chitinophagia bacterium]|nr:carbohydrate-binding protein [Chitinophagia bacterium]
MKNFYSAITKSKNSVLKVLGFGLTIIALNVLSAYKIVSDPGPAPDPNRFKKVVLTEAGKFDEPMEMTFLPGNRIVIVERKGGVKVVDTKTGAVKLIATIPVNTKYKNKQGQVREAEEGLMGVVADPNYAQNHWIYLYYADPNETKHVLTRWELIGDELKLDSKKVVLEVATQREECCHTGGGMVFDEKGNLFLTVGNNTVNPRSGTSNLDDRPGFENNDDQRAPGNTNDLRGKILRIHPEKDGSYTIPEGNLFPKGTPKTRPEIYTMGHRNPWRVSIDNKTGFIYWGEVGPDASAETARGPRGYDEFNQAKGPGFFGWPYFIGNNIPYVEFHHQDSTYGKAFDALHPVNKSRNNTGLTELPLPVPAMIWYPYSMSDEFPLVGAAGRSATGGPVYRKSDFPNAVRPFPSYYEGKWLIVEFMRGWIMSVTMDENGNYKSMEKFAPELNFSSAIDMKFGPEGDLYVLEYGSAWFKGNENAHLTRVEYNDGNRQPVVNASASKTSGAAPLKTQLLSTGTKDFDGDQLKYEWKIVGGGTTKIMKEENPVLTLAKAGAYKATLTVTDAKGAKSSKAIDLKVGNEPPMVSFDLSNANKTFYFPGTKLNYQVKVQDKEDGSLANGKIQPSQIAVSLDYMPLGYDQIDIASTQRGADMSAFSSTGQILMNKSDCKSCHMMNKRSVGPSYIEVSNKYRGKNGAVESLAQKVIKGGAGVWGDHAMSAHPNLSVADARAIVEYILTTGEKKSTVKSAPIKGEYEIKAAADQKEKGTYVFRAAYRDKGTASMSPLVGEEVVLLRHPTLNPELADFNKGFNKFITPSKTLNMDGDGSYLAYKDIDLTGIGSVAIKVNGNMRGSSAGGVIEVRLDAADGTMIGKTDFVNFTQRGQNKAVASINDTVGKHTLFFVFRNPSAKPGQTLLQPIEMEMVLKQ